MTIPLHQIIELDYQIQCYANKLYKKAGGIIVSQIHDMLVLNNLKLYSECTKRAQRKIIKDNK